MRGDGRRASKCISVPKTSPHTSRVQAWIAISGDALKQSTMRQYGPIFERQVSRRGRAAGDLHAVGNRESRERSGALP